MFATLIYLLYGTLSAKYESTIQEFYNTFLLYYSNPFDMYWCSCNGKSITCNCCVGILVLNGHRKMLSMFQLSVKCDISLFVMDGLLWYS